MKLEHEADVAVAKRHPRFVIHRRDIVLADADLAAVDGVESAEDVQQRALPHAGRAHDREHLALLDGQVEIAQHVEPLVARRVELVESVNADKRHGYS